MIVSARLLLTTWMVVESSRWQLLWWCVCAHVPVSHLSFSQECGLLEWETDRTLYKVLSGCGQVISGSFELISVSKITHNYPHKGLGRRFIKKITTHLENCCSSLLNVSPVDLMSTQLSSRWMNHLSHSGESFAFSPPHPFLISGWPGLTLCFPLKRKGSVYPVFKKSYASLK